MTEPNAKLLADESVSRITIDGRAWPVPKLAIKQNKVILPLLTKVGFGTSKILGVLDTAEGIDAYTTVVLVALQRAHEDLTREELEGMPMGGNDLILAVNVIANQTGMYRTKKADEVTGPLVPTAETPSPTGTT
jgi:hypothetical protein